MTGHAKGIAAAGLLAWLVTALVLWATASPLGDNEAAYARAAMLQLGGEPPQFHYLSRGMSVVAAPGVLAGGDERSLRTLPVALGVGFVLAAMLLARRAAGPAVAAWLPAVLAGSLYIAKRSADLLSDLPAAGLVLAGLAVLISELTRPDGPRWRMMLAAPALAAAVYVRYGSVLPIAVIAGVLVAAFPRALLRRPARLAATVGLFLALLVPHAVDAWAVTGSPLGYLLAGGEVLRVQYRGEGLVGLVTASPLTYYGYITTPVMLLGLASIARPRDRAAVALWLIAVLTVIAIGLTTVAESRYVVVSGTILLILGLDAAQRVARAWPARSRGAALAIAGVAVAASWLAIAVPSLGQAERRRARWAGILETAAVVRGDAAGAPCRVVARHTSQLAWYSRCDAVLEVPPSDERRLYLVRDGLGDAQPPAAATPGARALLARGELLVQRLTP
jgi:hypothetical protein